MDDDIYPTAPADPFTALTSQDWFGVVRPEGPMTADSMSEPSFERWFLWAGFSMFRFDAVRHKPLDFSQDWFLQLDTGGANWDVIYSQVARGDLTEQETIFVPFKEGLDVSEAPFQWCGDWLHEVGVMGRAEFSADKRNVVSNILKPHLERAKAKASGANAAD
ncbi:hypothetical protein [Afipia birgiae]|uniref:hypothetical protein n=1 Tax=Afipia birgiae TaxID=151414 RepID=UPI001FCAD7B0|nr:hypothetical protein [Afipia birgiae]